MGFLYTPSTYQHRSTHAPPRLPYLLPAPSRRTHSQPPQQTHGARLLSNKLLAAPPTRVSLPARLPHHRGPLALHHHLHSPSRLAHIQRKKFNSKPTLAPPILAGTLSGSLELASYHSRLSMAAATHGYYACFVQRLRLCPPPSLASPPSYVQIPSSILVRAHAARARADSGAPAGLGRVLPVSLAARPSSSSSEGSCARSPLPSLPPSPAPPPGAVAPLAASPAGSRAPTLAAAPPPPPGSSAPAEALVATAVARSKSSVANPARKQ
jgi:hypothetical protein